MSVTLYSDSLHLHTLQSTNHLQTVNNLSVDGHQPVYQLILNTWISEVISEASLYGNYTVIIFTIKENASHSVKLCNANRIWTTMISLIAIIMQMIIIYLNLHYYFTNVHSTKCPSWLTLVFLYSLFKKCQKRILEWCHRRIILVP